MMSAIHSMSLINTGFRHFGAKRRLKEIKETFYFTVNELPFLGSSHCCPL